MDYLPPSRSDCVAALAAGLAAAALPPLLVAAAPGLTATSIVNSAVWACTRFLACWLFGRYVASEVRQARRLVEPRDAAYPDSRFVRVADGILVHYFEEAPPAGAGPRASPAVVLVHGFGSSAASCRHVMRLLADRLRTRVVAFDMPGFGLTERPRRLADYDASAVLEGVVDALGLGDRLLLVGHSLGGRVVADLAARPSSLVAAAILVAPAVAAPPACSPALAGEAPPLRSASARLFRAPVAVLSALAGCCRRAAVAALLYAAQAVLGLLEPAAAAGLRRLVYHRNFWRRGLAAVYGGGALPQEATVAEYRRASRVRGWDRGLIRFIRFRAGDGLGLWALLRRAWRSGGGGDAELVARLRAAGRPVLVVHGAEDRIVPPANSRALCAALAGGRGGAPELRELAGCGHCALEEAPCDVVDAVVALASALPPLPAPCKPPPQR